MCNGSQKWEWGLGQSGHDNTSVSVIGSFVDEAAKNTFSGLWIANRFTVKPESETFFFTRLCGRI